MRTGGRTAPVRKWFQDRPGSSSGRQRIASSWYIVANGVEAARGDAHSKEQPLAFGPYKSGLTGCRDDAKAACDSSRTRDHHHVTLRLENNAYGPL